MTSNVTNSERKPIRIRTTASNLTLLTIGVLVYILSMNSVLVPRQFLNGGVTGIALIIHYLFPVFSVGLLYTTLNVPLFILGWITVSRRFILYTAYGILCFSLLADLVKVPPIPVADPLLAAVLAGIGCGIGQGIIFRSAGSAGGIDILAVFLYKRFSLGLGMTSFLVNSLILSAAALFFNLESALYTLIFVYVQARLTDAVITGFNRRESVFIISDKSEQIAEAIMTGLHRGVTFLDGVGAYTGRERSVILTIITLTELARLKELIFGIDQNAFLIVNESLEVIGRGHGRLKVY